jgi:glycosyltransferase involved in cell wall biosynthesis
MAQPLISVCIPAFNNQDFIASTLGSVLGQTCNDFEIVVTDDCSTDETVAVVKRFADARIRLMQNPRNLGLGENWNQALRGASGKYIKLLCGDDIIYPDCLQRQVEALENAANTDVVLAVCNREVINSRNEVVMKGKRHFGSGRVGGKQLIRSCLRWGTNRIGEPAAGLFKRETLVKSGLFDPENPYLIDLAFWAELLKHGDAILDEKPMAAFRISRTSMTTRIGLNQAAYFRRFSRRMRADSFYRASFPDLIAGNMLSLQWSILRKFVIGRQSGG